jgi:hypothetical protein
MASDEALVLGFDRSGIAAAVHFSLDADGDNFIILAAARAARCTGLGYAREGVEVVLGLCRDIAAERGIASWVFARVHPRNEASLKLLVALGFKKLGTYDGGLETWTHDLGA